MLQHPICVCPVNATARHVEGVDVALTDLNLWQLRRASGGLLDVHGIVVEADDSTVRSNRFRERREISARTASEVQHYVITADCELGGRQALV